MVLSTVSLYGVQGVKEFFFDVSLYCFPLRSSRSKGVFKIKEKQVVAHEGTRAWPVAGGVATHDKVLFQHRPGCHAFP